MTDETTQSQSTEEYHSDLSGDVLALFLAVATMGIVVAIPASILFVGFAFIDPSGFVSFATTFPRLMAVLAFELLYGLGLLLVPDEDLANLL